MELTVSKLAARAGLGSDTVRYYERAGLLPSPKRSAAGYRLFDEGIVDRLLFIRGARRTGLKLRQIRGLLEITDRGLCPCGHTEVMLRERIDEIDREMAQLNEIRTQLATLRQKLPSADECVQGSEPWPCERVFVETGATTK